MKSFTSFSIIGSIWWLFLITFFSPASVVHGVCTAATTEEHEDSQPSTATAEYSAALTSMNSLNSDNETVYVRRLVETGVHRGTTSRRKLLTSEQPTNMPSSTPICASTSALYFPGYSTASYVQVEPFTFPNTWTIEAWIKPMAQYGFFLSFASSSNYNCMLLSSAKWPDVGNWLYVVITYDGSSTVAYVDGVLTPLLVDGPFCGTYTGALVLGQDQDSYGGRFESNQAARMYVDTVAVYNGAWSALTIISNAATDKTCVDTTDDTLHALWAGDSSVDETGNGYNPTIATFGSLGTRIVNGDCLIPKVPSCRVEPSTMSFPGYSTDFYMQVEPFTFPDTWTIEAWIKPMAQLGTFLSFATTTNYNCIRLGSTAWPSTGSWLYVVFTYDGSSTVAYVDGVLTNSLIFDSYCGTQTGSLVIGQDQDNYGGGFASGDASQMYLDTVAVYSEAWSSLTISTNVAIDKTCVHKTDTALHALWTGGSTVDGTGNGYDATATALNSTDGYTVECGNPTPLPSETPTSSPTMSPAPSFLPTSTTSPTTSLLPSSMPSPSPTQVPSVSLPCFPTSSLFFQGYSTLFYFKVEPFIFPPTWTIEAWIKPMAQYGFFLSFASSSSSFNTNCILLSSAEWPSIESWLYVVITYDGSSTNAYVDGILTNSLINGAFCGAYSGSLVLGQDQDSYGGRFESNQAASMYVDTVAVYNGAWSSSYLSSNATTDKTCVDTTDDTLYALWAGDSSVDQTGNGNDATITAVSSAASRIVNGDCLIPKVPSCSEHTSLYFPGYSTSYYMKVEPFTFTDNWTIEMWIKPMAQYGFFLSFAATYSINCMNFLSNQWPTIGSWLYVVLTYDGSSQNAYVDGVLTNSLQSSLFCGYQTGALVFGHEQDSYGGGFASTQASNMYLDTVAVYSEAWSSLTISTNIASGKTCVDTTHDSLYALWTGGATDKTGNGNDATITTPSSNNITTNGACAPPTSVPSQMPSSRSPTVAPTTKFPPSLSPTVTSPQPSMSPSLSFVPTYSLQPSSVPSISKAPIPQPTHNPTSHPIPLPTLLPSMLPSPPPTILPTPPPTATPTILPTPTPTISQQPTSFPTAQPTGWIELRANQNYVSMGCVAFVVAVVTFFLYYGHAQKKRIRGHIYILISAALDFVSDVGFVNSRLNCVVATFGAKQCDSEKKLGMLSLIFIVLPVAITIVGTIMLLYRCKKFLRWREIKEYANITLLFIMFTDPDCVILLPWKEDAYVMDDHSPFPNRESLFLSMTRGLEDIPQIFIQVFFTVKHGGDLGTWLSILFTIISLIYLAIAKFIEFSCDMGDTSDEDTDEETPRKLMKKGNKKKKKRGISFGIKNRGTSFMTESMSSTPVKEEDVMNYTENRLSFSDRSNREMEFNLNSRLKKKLDNPSFKRSFKENVKSSFKGSFKDSSVQLAEIKPQDVVI